MKSASIFGGACKKVLGMQSPKALSFSKLPHPKPEQRAYITSSPKDCYILNPKPQNAYPPKSFTMKRKKKKNFKS